MRILLSRWALNKDYGQKNLVLKGPLYKSFNVVGDKIRIIFEYAQKGLMLANMDGLPASPFSTCGY